MISSPDRKIIEPVARNVADTGKGIAAFIVVFIEIDYEMRIGSYELLLCTNTVCAIPFEYVHKTIHIRVPLVGRRAYANVNKPIAVHISNQSD